MRALVLISVLSLSVAACTEPMERPHMGHDGDAARPMVPPMRHEHIMTLRDAGGYDHGRVVMAGTPEGLEVRVNAVGLTPGLHGIHIHAVGLCESPEFKSSGGHWNPDMRQHGFDNPMGHHRGDLPNLNVGGDGHGEARFMVPSHYREMLADHGVAVIIHAGPDDMRSDPAGNSGGRILCAAFNPGD